MMSNSNSSHTTFTNPSSNNATLNYNYNYNSSKNSINSSPNLSSVNNLPNANNLGNFLNIPDSFLEQLASQEYIDHLKSQQQQQFQSTEFNSDDMFTNDFCNTQHQDQVNPFTDYGNPNSFIRPLQQQPQQHQQLQSQYSANDQLPQAFPTRRRRKITLLNDGEGMSPSSNRKKHFDEEYLLFNPDISPGQIINQNDLDSSLVIPPNSNELFLPEQESTAFVNDIIPGYENDYLFLDEDDEPIEEDLSDDEGDDDNYFQVDDDFDAFMMNNIDYQQDYSNFDNNYTDSTPKSQSDFDQPREVSPSVISPPSQDADAMMVDEEHISPVPQQQTINVAPAVSEVKPIIAKKPKKETKGTSTKAKKNPHSMSGAEISANNPNHQCTLINPSTGQPCNKHFSRPYDLIRHQDTIHASMKKIFRCVICEGRLHGGPGNGKDKTFSRGDALSRHIKIKHGLEGDDALDLINEAKANVEYIPV
ncbi:RPN4 Transcriptional regulator RPN4 [Candida maltosa Xu316]